MNNCKLTELEQDLPVSRQASRMSSRMSGKNSSRSQIHQVMADIPLDIVRASANAVWNCCRSALNRKMVTSSEIPPYLIRLLELTTNEDIHLPVIGIINSCAIDVSVKPSFYAIKIRLVKIFLTIDFSIFPTSFFCCRRPFASTCCPPDFCTMLSGQ